MHRDRHGAREPGASAGADQRPLGHRSRRLQDRGRHHGNGAALRHRQDAQMVGGRLPHRQELQNRATRFTSRRAARTKDRATASASSSISSAATGSLSSGTDRKARTCGAASEACGGWTRASLRASLSLRCRGSRAVPVVTLRLLKAVFFLGVLVLGTPFESGVASAQTPSAARRPIVFIPGLLGSRLCRDNPANPAAPTLVWGSAAALKLSLIHI